MFKYIHNRLTEYSTWLGVILLATACGATIEAAIAKLRFTSGLAVAGLSGVVTKDNTYTKKDVPQ